MSAVCQLGVVMTPGILRVDQVGQHQPVALRLPLRSTALWRPHPFGAAAQAPAGDQVPVGQDNRKDAATDMACQGIDVVHDIITGRLARLGGDVAHIDS